MPGLVIRSGSIHGHLDEECNGHAMLPLAGCGALIAYASRRGNLSEIQRD